MTLANNLKGQPIHTANLIKAMAIGGAIALAAMAVFISGARNNPAWGEYWRIRPLVCATLGGAGGGLFFYFMGYFLGGQGGWKKPTAIIIGLIGFLIAVFLGSVYGMDGTLWD